MTEKPIEIIEPKKALFCAIILHCCVEIPFFIFPVVLLVVGEDLFPNLGELSWFGLGSIGTIGTLAAGLPSPIFGRLADKYHYATLMVISLVFAALGSLLVGLYGESFVIMLIGVILMGLGLALYHPPGLSWISEAYEDPKMPNSYSENYVRILAIHGIGGSVGSSLGPLSVYFLINTFDWKSIYLFWSFPLIVIAITFWFFIGKKDSTKKLSISSSSQETKSTMKNKKNTHTKNLHYYALFFIFGFIISMSLTRGMVNFILSPFLSEVKNLEISTAALYIGISTLIGSVGQVLGGVFGDKYGEKTVLSFTAIFQAFILIGIFVNSDTIVLLFLYILLGLMNALFWPSTNSLVAKNSVRARQARAFGWVMLAANLIGALGPFIDGILLALAPNQYSLIFTFACLFSISGFFSLLFLKSPTNELENGTIKNRV